MFYQSAMWFFDLFKKKEKVLSNDVINFSELEKWLEEKTQKRVNELNKNTSGFISKIKEEVEELKLNVFKLENAEINKDIHIVEGAKQKVLGNRESYIKDVNFFISNIQFSDDPMDFYSKLENSLNELAKTTVKNHAIVEQLFGEVSFVAGNLGNLGKLVNEIKNACNSQEITAINEVKSLIKEINKKIELRGIIDEEIKNREIEKFDLENYDNELKKNMEELKNNEKYLKLQSLLDEKEKNEFSLKESEEKIKHVFVPLQKSLRKFYKIKNDSLLLNYTEDPAKALVNDKELKIIELVEEMQGSIEQLELNEQKEKRVVEELNSLDGAALKYLAEIYNELSNTKKKLNESILRNEMSHKQWILNEKLKNTEEKIKAFENKTIDLEAKKQKVEFSELSKIEENLEKLELKIKVNI